MDAAAARHEQRATGERWLAAVGLLLASSVAAAEPVPAPAEPAAAMPDAAPAPVVTTAATVTPEARSPRVHQHAIGLGYHAVWFGTKSGDHYILHGPAVAYDYFIGTRWGLAVRAAYFYLVSGRMSGPSGEFTASLGSLYDQRHHGFDTLVMAARRLPLAPDYWLTVGFGPHLQGFALNGTVYSPVEDVSLGVGGLGKVDHPINDWLAVTGQLELGLDLVDLIDHANPSRWVVPISATISLAARH